MVHMHFCCIQSADNSHLIIIRTYFCSSWSAYHNLYVFLFQSISCSWFTCIYVVVVQWIIACIYFSYSWSADYDMYGLFHCRIQNHQYDSRLHIPYDALVPWRPTSRTGGAGRCCGEGQTAPAGWQEEVSWLQRSEQPATKLFPQSGEVCEPLRFDVA